VNSISLDQLVARIDAAFGATLAFTDTPLAGADIDALERLFGNDGFQAYLQDEINRQVIRDYLANAVRLGYLGEPGLEQYCELIATIDGRALLALHMIVHAVEDAAYLPAEVQQVERAALEADQGEPVQLELVRS
jgi:hypothetical protein